MVLTFFVDKKSNILWGHFQTCLGQMKQISGPAQKEQGLQTEALAVGCRLLKCSLVIVPYIGDGEYKLHLMYLLKDALS